MEEADRAKELVVNVVKREPKWDLAGDGQDATAEGRRTTAQQFA